MSVILFTDCIEVDARTLTTGVTMTRPYTSFLGGAYFWFIEPTYSFIAFADSKYMRLPDLKNLFARNLFYPILADIVTSIFLVKASLNLENSDAKGLSPLLLAESDPAPPPPKRPARAEPPPFYFLPPLL